MIDPKLLEAYRNTAFIVSTGDGEIRLRIGERSRELDDLLKQFGVTSCAFVTAWNPGSIKLTDRENATRQRALVTEAQRRGYPLLSGRGVGADGNWPAEDSVLIMGVGRSEAAEIGRLFGQLCAVYAERGCLIKLLFP